MGDQLEDCLLRFEEVYSDPMCKFRKLLATAAAHIVSSGLIRF
jgi:hypothetical protein